MMMASMFLVAHVATFGSGRVTLREDAPGAVALLIDGVEWLGSGPTSFHTNGQWFCTEGERSAACQNALILESQTESEGSDSLGAFARKVWTWSDAKQTACAFRWQTAARVYFDSVVFEQTWMTPCKATAWEGTATGDKDGLVSTFPSFSLAANQGRGYLQYAKDMVGSGYSLGRLGKATVAIGSGITGTAPLVLFGTDLQTSLVLSPFSNFMATSQRFVPDAHGGGQLSYGLMGNLTAVPSGFSVEVIVSLSKGIQAGLLEWGDKLLRRYGKTRDAAWQRDMTLRFLGYSTDNGAYYYYNKENGTTYEQTMLDVAAYARREGLPYRYWLADSWWYYQGANGGLTNWTARPDVFPHGLSALYEQTGWMVQGHSRFWSNETTYAKQNGGRWAFLFDAITGYALPTDQGFWDELLRTARSWGLVVYEQDWLDKQMDLFGPLTQNATLGQQWLHQMGAAAEATGISIQYCMSHSRHILASVEIPSVTQARASPDYHPGGYPHREFRDQWSQLGTTSIFAYALGLAPSKDNFWSTPSQPGSPYGNDTEPLNRLQSAVLTLSKGPVCPSDAIGRSDARLIMRSAAADGTLLQPGTPAMKLDQALLAAALSNASTELWAASTHLSGRRFSVVLGARVESRAMLPPLELGYSAASAERGLAAVEANASGAVVHVDAKTPLAVPACGEADFQLFNLAPREDNGWALLGEVSTKWVGVSLARFSGLTSPGVHADPQSGRAADLSVEIRGHPGEQVVVSFAPPVPLGASAHKGAGSLPVAVSATCTISAGGTAWAAAGFKTSLPYAYCSS